MFERYTEPARRVLFFARYEASQLGSTSIDGGHLLLGVIRETHGTAHRILSTLPLERIRQDVVSRMPFEKKLSTSVEIPFAPGATRVIEGAAEEADALQHSHIGTEHLLLGLLRDEGALPGAILASHGVTIGDVRARIRQEAGPGPDTIP